MDVEVKAPSKIGPYQIKGTVGKGAFSVVNLAYDETKKLYLACKIVPKSRLSTRELEERFQIEIRVFQRLNHPGIVQLYDLLKDDVNYYVFMEFCPNGELFQHIVDKGKLTEDDAKVFVRQLIITLKYIHEKDIVHRDLKPENLLINDKGYIKVSDFGLSKFIRDNELTKTPCGSPCYASPECISGLPYNAKSSDVWSVGVIVYAMLTGQLPWTKRNQAQLFQQIKKGEYSIPKSLTEDCQSFISRLMTVDVDKRMTLEEALEHSWLKMDVSDDEIFSPQRFSTFISCKKVDSFFDKTNPNDNLSNIKVHKNRSFAFLRFADAMKVVFSRKKLPPVSNQVVNTKTRPIPTVVIAKNSVKKSPTSKPITALMHKKKKAKAMVPKVRKSQMIN